MRKSSILIVSCLITPLLLAQQAGPPTPRTVLGVAFSPDGKYLAAGVGLTKERGSVFVWDVATQKTVWKLESQMGTPSVALAPDGRTLAVAMYDKAAKLLDAANGKEIAAYAHPAEVRGVSFSPDGKLVATASWDGVARIWDIAGGKEKAAFGGPKDRLRAVQFSPDGKLLMANGGTNGIRLWDIDGRAEKPTLKGVRSSDATQIAPDGVYVLSGSNSGTVRVWELNTGETRAIFSDMGSAYWLAYSSKAELLAVCGSGANFVYLYDLPLREPTAKEQQHIAGLIAKFTDDSYDLREATSKELLKIGFIAERQLSKAMKESASAEVRIRCRTVREQMLTQPRTRLFGHTDQAQCVAFSPDGKLLASGATDGTVRLWDFAESKEIVKWQVD